MPIDYNAVIAVLEAKRAQIDTAIAVLRALAENDPTRFVDISSGVIVQGRHTIGTTGRP